MPYEKVNDSTWAVTLVKILFIKFLGDCQLLFKYSFVPPFSNNKRDSVWYRGWGCDNNWCVLWSVKMAHFFFWRSFFCVPIDRKNRLRLKFMMSTQFWNPYIVDREKHFLSYSEKRCFNNVHHFQVYYVIYHQMPYSELLYFTGSVHIFNSDISDLIVSGHYYLALLQFSL